MNRLLSAGPLSSRIFSSKSALVVPALPPGVKPSAYTRQVDREIQRELTRADLGCLDPGCLSGKIHKEKGELCKGCIEKRILKTKSEPGNVEALQQAQTENQRRADAKVWKQASVKRHQRMRAADKLSAINSGSSLDHAQNRSSSTEERLSLQSRSAHEQHGSHMVHEIDGVPIPPVAELDGSPRMSDSEAATTHASNQSYQPSFESSVRPSNSTTRTSVETLSQKYHSTTPAYRRYHAYCSEAPGKSSSSTTGATQSRASVSRPARTLDTSKALPRDPAATQAPVSTTKRRREMPLAYRSPTQHGRPSTSGSFARKPLISPTTQAVLDKPKAFKSEFGNP